MVDFIKKNSLLFVVFLTGACVLVIEVVATRILSPYFGNTIFTVSSVISVVLAALSIGYYVGGKLADKTPSEKLFYSIILAGGLSVLLLQLLNIKLLPYLGYKLSLTNGPLISTIIMFFLPSFLLGMLSPFAIKLQESRATNKGIGSIAGEMFFWSTLGSIFGSLATGFIFIPKFGINQIVLATGIVLCALGLFPLFQLNVSKKKILSIILIISASFFLINFAEAKKDPKIIYSKDGVYEKLTIKDEVYKNKNARLFFQDKTQSGGMYLDTSEHIFEYSKYHALYKVLKPDIKDVIVLGGGIYTVPKTLSESLPDANILVSEIEPSLYDLSQKYFDLKNTKNITNNTNDGRRVLHDSEKQFDMIFSDVYYSLLSVPANFTTKEFFQIAKNKLKPDGIFIGNIIGSLSRQSPSFMLSEIKTFQSVFPNSYFFAARSAKHSKIQNIIFVAYNSDKKIDFHSREITNNSDEFIRTLPDKLINLDRLDFSKAIIFTDNYAPVDSYVSKSIKFQLISESKPIDGAEMLALVEQQKKYGTKSANQNTHDKIQKLIELEINTLADKFTKQTWVEKLSENENSSFANFIGQFYPEKSKRIILITRYGNEKNNSVNGTGILIEIANFLASRKEDPGIGIDLVFLDEGKTDKNNAGIKYFSENLQDIYPDTKPQNAVVIDVICDKNFKVYPEQSSKDLAPELHKNFLETARSINSGLFKTKVIAAINNDHTYLNKAGIPSILLTNIKNYSFEDNKEKNNRCTSKFLETIGNAALKYAFTVK